MACCLKTPSHYMNQCWHENIGIHHSAISQKMRETCWKKNINDFWLFYATPRRHWVNTSWPDTIFPNSLWGCKRNKGICDAFMCHYVNESCFFRMNIFDTRPRWVNETTGWFSSSNYTSDSMCSHFNLTHCGLGMPYSNMYMGQHWFR